MIDKLSYYSSLLDLYYKRLSFFDREAVASLEVELVDIITKAVKSDADYQKSKDRLDRFKNINEYYKRDSRLNVYKTTDILYNLYLVIFKDLHNKGGAI